MDALLFKKIKAELLNTTANQISFYNTTTAGHPWWNFNGDSIGICVTKEVAKTKESAVVLLHSKNLLDYLKKCNNRQGNPDEINLLGKKVFVVCRSKSLFAITHSMDIHV
jgi:hypothetical protein